MLVFLSVSPPPSLLFSPSTVPWTGEMMGLQEMSGGEATATEEEGLLSIEQELFSSLTEIITDCQMSKIPFSQPSASMEDVFESTLFLLDSSLEDSLASSAFLFFSFFPDQIFCLGLQGSFCFFSGLNKLNSVSPVLLMIKSLKIFVSSKNVNYV